VDVSLPEGMQPNSQDNRILKVCKGLWNQGESVILVTRDIVVRIKAQMMGIPAEDFTTDQVPASSGQYTGRTQVYTPDEALSSFKKKGVPAELLYTVDDNGISVPVKLIENQFVMIRSDVSEKKTILGRFQKGKVVALGYKNIRPFVVKARNVGQQFLQEALMLPADEAPLVIVKGPAGTAKTFYALAVGLEKTVDERTNGLSYAAERMKGSPLSVQLAMLPDECVRSDLALDAAQRM
jgi:PhoH-like ATPase